MKNKRIGRVGEDRAVDYLKKHRYKIVERNFATKFGEIDIICKKNNILIFVEVKTSLQFSKGRPEWRIKRSKIAQVQKMAYSYLMKNKLEHKNLRIDAICVILDRQIQVEDLTHYQNMTAEFNLV